MKVGYFETYNRIVSIEVNKNRNSHLSYYFFRLCLFFQLGVFFQITWGLSFLSLTSTCLIHFGFSQTLLAVIFSGYYFVQLFFLVVIVTWVSLNNGKIFAFLFISDRKTTISDFNIVSKCSKILMNIIFSNRILILNNVVGYQRVGAKFATMSFSELIKSIRKNLYEHWFYCIFIFFEPEFFDNMCDRHSKTSFGNQMFHDSIILIWACSWKKRYFLYGFSTNEETSMFWSREIGKEGFNIFKSKYRYNYKSINIASELIFPF